MRRSVAVVAALLIVATGCIQRRAPIVLHVLADAELSDMAGILRDAESATGVRVELTPTGSLAGAESVAAGSGGDAAWFSSDRYISLLGATSMVLDRTPTMASPVVVGVRRSVAERLGWMPPAKVGWKDVADAAAHGKFRFAMTDAATTNSGFTALVGVANAGSGSGALTPDVVDEPALAAFMRGRRASVSSSGSLADVYAKQQRRLDGIISYESVALSLDDNERLQEPHELIYPIDGTSTADYPLLLLDRSKRDAYEKVTDYLRRPDVQAEIERQTSRRPIVHGVRLDPRMRGRLVVEMPFPAGIDVVRALMEATGVHALAPSHIFYVLDTSISMQGERLADLKRAVDGLAGLGAASTGGFARPASHERATVIVATDSGGDASDYEIDPTTASSRDRAALRRDIDGLRADGGTLLFDAVLHAYELAGRSLASDPGTAVSIVVMTDGEHSGGLSYRTFTEAMRSQSAAVRRIPSYVLLFGPLETHELPDLARRSGGKVFDAQDVDLAVLFKEIRGYR